jgi:hypothetical protein
MLAPGVVLDRLHRDRDPVRAAMCATLLSPILLTTLSILGMLTGRAPLTMAALVAGASMLSFVALAARSRSHTRVSLRPLLPLLGVLVLVATLSAFLPLTREWWRMRSDAWFHAAVVAEIAHYGLPPTDPYFTGIPLQYMWFYHVMVLTVAKATNLSSFWVMALANLQAVLGLGLAAYALASVFRDRVTHRLTATISLLFAFNGAFWLLLPIKAIRALLGDVRGREELARTFALSPMNFKTAYSFMHIYFNQEFFLDKFMVATAFGFALAFMMVGWYAATNYLVWRRRASLVVLSVALIGMLGFHSLVGFVMMVAIVGSAALMLLLRRAVDPVPLRALVARLGPAVASLFVTTPYLFEVMHLR